MLVKSGTGATATTAAPEAATEQTRNHRRTDKGNAIVLQTMQETKQSNINEKDLYTLVTKKKSSNKLTKERKQNQ